MMNTSEPRMGTDVNPDLLLGLLTSIFTILLLHMSIPFLSAVILIMTTMLSMMMIVFMFSI